MSRVLVWCVSLAMGAAVTLTVLLTLLVIGWFACAVIAVSVG